jgi:hypothetical protein
MNTLRDLVIYTAEIVAVGPASHYSPGHCEFDGIIVSAKRRAYSVAADGTVLAERVLVSISLDQLIGG